MGDRWMAIGPEPLDVAALSRLVSAAGPGCATAERGAVVTFVGIVRAESGGRRVLGLEYEAFEPLALRTFALIGREVGQWWPAVRIALHHRTGSLGPGEASVAIAAAARHRGEAFAACRYIIERVKQIAPVWKREFFEGGDAWVEGATVDPSDEVARAEAYRRSCA